MLRGGKVDGYGILSGWAGDDYDDDEVISEQYIKRLATALGPGHYDSENAMLFLCDAAVGPCATVVAR